MLLIKNGRLHDMVNKEAYVADILVENGKITKIEANLTAPADAEVIDAAGKDVYPGFVDAHSHLGGVGYGIKFEGDDYNEMTDIMSPQLRGIDSFNPMDPTFPMAAAAGITCIGTGPGSANVIGGTFFAAKTTGKRVDDMIVRNPVAMKCAFGENPKRCYKDKNNYARMSTASKLREALMNAQDYQERKQAAGDDPLKQPQFDMKSEALIPVLNGEIPLKAHAHQANDIFTAIRIAKEFGVKLTLEHVMEGHLIVDELVKENLPCAVGPNFGHATKFELKNQSWTTPGVLAKAGLQVSIITDAPVVPEEYLPLCAALAIQAGMDYYDALKAITINPAKHLGIEDRVGSLEVGKDADILIYSADPLDGLSTPDAVFIDGKKIK